MDIRIGIVNVAREIHIEVDDDAAPAVAEAAAAAAAGDTKVLWVQDRSGRRVAIPADKLAYVDIGPSGDRRVGFAGT